LLLIYSSPGLEPDGKGKGGEKKGGNRFLACFPSLSSREKRKGGRKEKTVSSRNPVLLASTRPVGKGREGRGGGKRPYPLPLTAMKKKKKEKKRRRPEKCDFELILAKQLLSLPADGPQKKRKRGEKGRKAVQPCSTPLRSLLFLSSRYRSIALTYILLEKGGGEKKWNGGTLIAPILFPFLSPFPYPADRDKGKKKGGEGAGSLSSKLLSYISS